MSPEYLEYLIATYGYYALFAGTCLEGETVMVLAGIAAHEKMLCLPWVILLGFLGSLLGDQTIFFVSRMWGNRIVAFVLRRFGKQSMADCPSWQRRIEKVNRLLERHGTWYMLSFRFFYGLRNPTPVVIGLSSIPTWKFVVLNVTGAVIWAMTLGCMGYLLGEVAKSILSDLKWLILGIAVLAFLVWLVRHIWLTYRARQARRAPPETKPPP